VEAFRAFLEAQIWNNPRHVENSGTEMSTVGWGCSSALGTGLACARPQDHTHTSTRHVERNSGHMRAEHEMVQSM
jgi:hypothetical protein